MAKNTAVFGIYSDYETLETAVEALKNAGFRNTDVSLLCSENVGSKDFAHVKSTKAPEGATAGAASGAVIGGAVGWLLGIGALAIPGIGPLVAAGPIVAALAGLGTGGAVGGIVMGVLTEWALMIVSSLVGAIYAMDLFRLSPTLKLMLTGLVFLAGALTQVVMRRMQQNAK